MQCYECGRHIEVDTVSDVTVFQGRIRPSYPADEYTDLQNQCVILCSQSCVHEYDIRAGFNITGES